MTNVKKNRQTRFFLSVSNLFKWDKNMPKWEISGKILIGPDCVLRVKGFILKCFH